MTERLQANWRRDVERHPDDDSWPARDAVEISRRQESTSRSHSPRQRSVAALHHFLHVIDHRLQNAGLFGQILR